MHLAYVLVLLLHLSAASTCYATSRNQHLFFAGRADDAATALLPAASHHHHYHHTAKAEVPTCTPIAARSRSIFALRSRHDSNLDQAHTVSVHVDMQVLSDYNVNDVRHYHPPMPMMARWGGGAPPLTPRPPIVELTGIGGSPPPPPPSLSAVEPNGIEGTPPPPPPPTPRKQDTSAATEPSSPTPMPSPPHGQGASSSDASATGQEASATSDDVDVNVDYDGPMTHPPSHN